MIAFDAIKEAYKNKDLDGADVYFLDWTRHFTPIEASMWSEIRYAGLPMWPQYPIGRYFADFADPRAKVVIECDGKAFHNAQKDATRDNDMARSGWRVYRISGADCNRFLPAPWEVDQEAEKEALERIANDWLNRTAAGLVYRIAVAHYGRKDSVSTNYKKGFA